MEYLQYYPEQKYGLFVATSFKPYYKWNTFNTTSQGCNTGLDSVVLNLIINGIPSILRRL